MEQEEIRSTLTIPLYWTFHLLEDISQFKGLSDKQLRELREGYSLEDSSALVEALAWAEANPHADFSSMLPGLPYSNEELYRYLIILHDQLLQAYGDWRQGGDRRP